MLILIVLLGSVIYGIRQATPQNFQKALNALGLETGIGSPTLHSASRTLAPGEERLNICPTRVHAITWPDGKRIEEQKDGLKLRWMALDPEPREVGYLEIEKWLSQHCQIIIRPETRPETMALPAVGAAPLPRVVIEYLGGTSESYEIKAPGVFKWGERVFVSEDFANALADLRKNSQLN